MDKSAGITLHENSELHVASMSKWANWKQAQQDGNIAEKLELISRADILANRHYLQSVAQVVLVCAVQNIALCGHREGALEDEEAASTGDNCGPRNRGNFLEVLHTIAAHDPVVAQRLLHGPKNARYTHHDIQCEVLSILADMIRTDIIAEIQKSYYFSLMCDESRDSGKREQISLCLRYVSDGVMKEKFYNFFRAEGLGAEAITDKLTEVLATMQIDVPERLVAQCYNGASTMSGRLHGVQQRMRELVCPLGIFIHCWAHRLNLVVVSVSELTTKTAKHFDHLRKLHKFFSSSVPHDKFIEVQKEVYRDDADERGQALQIKELKSLSMTRWSCQWRAADAVMETLEAIICTAEFFVDDPVTRTEESKPRRSSTSWTRTSWCALPCSLTCSTIRRL